MAAILSHFHGNTRFAALSRSNPSRSLLSSGRRLMTVTFKARNDSYWASIEADIHNNLKKSIPIRPPISVWEPMNHLTFAAPRTTAPALCIAACELVGGNRNQAMAAASAIHLIHAAAYAHEHLPLTDRARPKPKIHHEFNPNVELLTGDGMVPFGFELLARSENPGENNSDRILRAIVEITRVAGSSGMIDGQYRKTACSQTDDEESCRAEWIEYASEKKEGVLYACAAACGAILGGGSEEEIERLRKYGLLLGKIHGMAMNQARGEGTKEEEEMLEKMKGMGMKELETFRDRRKLEDLWSLLVQ